MGHTNSLVKGIALKVGRLIPDKMFIDIRYRKVFGKGVDWKNPRTYNDKLQWMKVYDRNPLYTSLVDKYEVRKYIEKTIGKDYLFECIGVWDSYDEIDFSEFPNQFVLKCTHDSGSVLICKDKESFDYEYAKKHFNERLKKSSYYGGREWAYKNVKPRIIAEQYMVDETGTGLKDYKFFCFNGEVKALFIATDRGVEGTDVKFDFFDPKFNHLPFKHGHENAAVLPQKPDGFDNMLLVAEKLSQSLRHVRVDLYNINGRIYFGEMTFYHLCGFVPFDPEEWDYKFGSWINIH